MPSFTMVNSSSFCDSNPLSQWAFNIKSDVSIYLNPIRPSVKTDSALVDIFIEFKWAASDNLFYYQVNDSSTFLHDTKHGNDVLDQITAYAAVQLAAQFRMHIYSVFIHRNTARLL